MSSSRPDASIHLLLQRLGILFLEKMNMQKLLMQY